MSETAAVTAVGGSFLAFAGAWLGVRASRRSSLELDRWRRREETMRLLRWAAELACGEDARAAVGLATLDALRHSELVQHEDVDLVGRVLTTVIEHALGEYRADVHPSVTNARRVEG